MEDVMTKFAPSAAPFVIVLFAPLYLSSMAAGAQPLPYAPVVAHEAKAEPWHASQLSSIAKLDHNWDGYDADPVSAEIINLMRLELTDNRLNVFGVGHVVPGADGSLQAEWDDDDLSFGLLIEADGTFVFWQQPSNGPEIARSGLAGRDLMMALALGLPKA